MGVTTNEIDEWVHRETLSRGAVPAPLNYGRGQGRNGMPFPKSICTSLNEVICHGIPNNHALQNGDILNVDVTCDYLGFFGDASRMFIIGEVPERTRELVEVTRECLNLGIEQVHGDLVTLLLCFFILLFSQCKYETMKFKSLAASFKPLPAGTPFMNEGKDSIVEQIAQQLEESELGDDANINVEEKGVVVSFKASAYFKSDSAKKQKMLE